MHSFEIDINVGKRFLETYAIHLVSKYLLRRIATLSHSDPSSEPVPMMMDVQAYGDVTRITVTGVPEQLAGAFPNAVPFVPEYEERVGMTTIRKLSPWLEEHAPKALELTILDQDYIARGLDMGYASYKVASEHDAEYFKVFTQHILPMMEPELRTDFDAWLQGMCEQAAANRQAHRSVIVDELPFIPNDKPRTMFFSTPERDERFAAALRSMDGRITTIDIVPVGSRILNTGPQSRQQFRNDREAPSRGKKGRVKIFAGKSGGCWPKPGGTRGY